MKNSENNGTVIITGVSGGIGLATAERLIKAEYRILGIDKKRGDFDSLPTDQKYFVEADVCDFKTQQQVALKEARTHHISGLVACAGILERKLYLELDEDSFDDHLSVNLKGPFFACQAVLPIMRGQKSGSIVIISSSIARTGSAGAAHYAASKGGILGLARTLALETARDGIRVNTVSPGVADTQMPRAHSSEEALQEKAKKIPLGRLAKATDVANAIHFLISDQAGYITGQDLRVTGGAALF